MQRQGTSEGVLYPEFGKDEQIASARDGLPTILLVDESTTDGALIESYVQGAYQVTQVRDPRAAIQFGRDHVPDCIVVEYQFGQMDGVELIVNLRENAYLKYTPIIMLSAFGTPEVTASALRSGADDFMSKAALSDRLLQHVVDSAIAEKRLSEAVDVERHAVVQENRELQRRHELFAEYWTSVAKDLMTSADSIRTLIAHLADEVPGVINAQQRKCLTLASEACADMAQSVGKISNVTELARNPGKMIWASENLTVLLDQTMDEVRLDASAKQIELVPELAEGVRVFTDKFLLSQAIYLVLQKAIGLSRKAGSVTVRNRDAATEGKVQVSIVVACDDDLSITALHEELDWQLAESLSAANASELRVQRRAYEGIEFSFELVKYLEIWKNGAAA